MGRPVIVDFHTHLLPASFRERRADIAARDATFGALFGAGGRMATADDLIAMMDESGVDLSVVLGFGWCDLEIAREANDCLLDAAARYPGRIAPFCSVHPGWGDDALREVERCVDAGAIGIGELHPTSQEIDLAMDESFEPLARLATERGLLVTVHGSEPVGHVYPGKGSTTPERLIGIVERFPDVHWVFAHWGGGLPFYALMPEVRAALANTSFDSAASPFLYDADVFHVASRAVGTERVLFGSDYPLLPASRVMEQARGTLDPAAAQAVLGGNAARLLGLADD